MSAFVRVLFVALFSLSVLATGACSSKKTIDATSAKAVIAGVNKGDYVIVTTRNDAVQKFKVTKITNKALYGNNARVVYEDMQKVVVSKKADKSDEDEDEEGGSFWSRIF